ncbi:MAG: heme ABC exporter ATP-binding protein CcmA [Proteobacteria bacterium]|nr:heme ABC exporter ATP-binding protein CcmA [Pseudomonadota bacterium]
MVSLSAQNLACIRGGRLVFRHVSLRADTGEFVSIEGPNGAGKTSLLRMIAGFLKPQAGDVRIQSEDETISDAEERGKYIGWFAHQDAVKPQLSVLENLQFFAELYGVRGDVSAALETVGLARAASLPGQYLSAGQKKRLALARLVLAGRPLWLLDEPFAALDVAGRALAVSLIAEHCAAGGIALAATHEPLGLDGQRLSLAGA